MKATCDCHPADLYCMLGKEKKYKLNAYVSQIVPVHLFRIYDQSCKL